MSSPHRCWSIEHALHPAFQDYSPLVQAPTLILSTIPAGLKFLAPTGGARKPDPKREVNVMDVCCIHPDLLVPFKLTGLDKVFEIHAEEQAALNKY